MLREFGLELDPDVELRVWDSSAEMRYLVLPERPEGTDGLSEEQLAALVTRDAMIGVAQVATAPAREHAAGRGRRAAERLRAAAARQRRARLRRGLARPRARHGRRPAEQLGLPWSAFRDHLVAAIERHGQPEGESAAEAYYVAFLDALESLVAPISPSL